MDEKKCDTIAALLGAGRTQSEIVTLTNYSQPTVSRYMADIAASTIPDTPRQRRDFPEAVLST